MSSRKQKEEEEEEEEEEEATSRRATSVLKWAGATDTPPLLLFPGMQGY